MAARRLVPLIVVLASSAPSLGAAEPVLLPRPREVRYGSGRLAVCSAFVEPGSPAADEDRFAAAELVATLSGACRGVEGPRSSGGRSPIRLVRTGASDPLPVPGESAGPGSREAYSLRIGPGGGEIRARSSAGLFYAVQTLRQLVQGSGPSASLPEVEIRDWPAFAYRGTMVDMSHGAQPTVAEIERQIDLLARFKANQYYFYSEASIELDGYPLLNPEGRFTKAQVREIVGYGRARHVDVVPFLELYGHLHDLLRVEHYSRLGAFPHAGEVDPSNPEVMTVIADWAAQLADLFPSPFVHVGFDETWQIERVAKARGGVAPARLFTKQLTDVTVVFQGHGKTVMAWADVVVKYPGILAELPKGLVPVAWDYDAQPDVRRWIDPLAAARLPHFVQTGVDNWNSVAVNFDKTFANIDNFVEAGRASGALGVINSVWLDSSFSPLRLSWPAFAYGTIVPWQSRAPERARFFSDYAALTTPPAAAADVAAALDSLNRSETTLESAIGGDGFYQMWEDPFDPAHLGRTAQHRETFGQARLLAEAAQAHLYAALGKGGRPETLTSLLFGARMLDYACFRFLNALEIAERWEQISRDFHPESFWDEFESEVTYQSHGRAADMMDAITQLRELYRGVWQAEYTPYRLGTTLGRFDAEYEYWRSLQMKLRRAARDVSGEKTLPPLDSVLSGRFRPGAPPGEAR